MVRAPDWAVKWVRVIRKLEPLIVAANEARRTVAKLCSRQAWASLVTTGLFEDMVQLVQVCRTKLTTTQKPSSKPPLPAEFVRNRVQKACDHHIGAHWNVRSYMRNGKYYTRCKMCEFRWVLNEATEAWKEYPDAPARSARSGASSGSSRAPPSPSSDAATSRHQPSSTSSQARNPTATVTASTRPTPATPAPETQTDEDMTAFEVEVPASNSESDDWEQEDLSEEDWDVPNNPDPASSTTATATSASRRARSSA